MPSPKPDAASSGDVYLLAVRQPFSDDPRFQCGHRVRVHQGGNAEVPSARTTLLESPVGTVEEVLSLMREAEWVNFACRGVQDDETRLTVDCVSPIIAA